MAGEGNSGDGANSITYSTGYNIYIDGEQVKEITIDGENVNGVSIDGSSV